MKTVVICCDVTYKVKGVRSVFPGSLLTGSFCGAAILCGGTEEGW